MWSQVAKCIYDRHDGIGFHHRLAQHSLHLSPLISSKYPIYFAILRCLFFLIRFCENSSNIFEQPFCLIKNSTQNRSLLTNNNQQQPATKQPISSRCSGYLVRVRFIESMYLDHHYDLDTGLFAHHCVAHYRERIVKERRIIMFFHLRPLTIKIK